jgi:hypothetical protein
MPSDADADDGFEICPKTSLEAAQRVLALMAVVDRVYEDPPTRVRAWVNANQIAQYFSPEESEFFFSDAVTEKQRIKFSWRTEALGTLLWALSGLKRMPSLNETVNLSNIDVVKDIILRTSDFLRDAALRSDDEIHDLEDSMCDAHWLVRDAQIHGKKLPAKTNPEIVQERRHSTCWLIGMGEDWDDVPIDT